MSSTEDRFTVKEVVVEMRKEMHEGFRTINDKLDAKGDKADLDFLSSRQDRLDRGDFSTSFLLAIKAVVLTEMHNRLTNTWALRANKAAWSIAFIAFAALCASVVSIAIR